MKKHKVAIIAATSFVVSVMSVCATAVALYWMYLEHHRW